VLLIGGVVASTSLPKQIHRACGAPSDALGRLDMKSRSKGRSGNIIEIGDGTRPLYKEVKLAITRMLSTGSTGPGKAIPTEKQLCNRFGVSVGTVRKAIDELVAERILIRQQGRGTFVATFSPERMLNYLWHIVRKDGVREIPIVQTLQFEKTKADRSAADQLAIAIGADIYSITNLLLLGGEPVILDRIQISRHMFPDLSEAKLSTRDTTIYGFYQSAYNVIVLNTVDKLNAVAADPTVAKLLGVALSTPLLEINRVAFTFEGRPVELRRTLMLSDRYEYVNTLSTNPSRSRE
jgi:GntR family transcriptional regulator